jgi:hypothetical protein
MAWSLDKLWIGGITNNLIHPLLLAQQWHAISIQVFKSIYVWRNVKEGSLFCFVVMRFTEPRCFRLCSWCLWKALDEEGCMGLVPWHLDLWCKHSWILIDFFSLKIKLNHSCKFSRNSNVPLVLFERSWQASFNGIYLVRFGFGMW